jgi:hypothetical protein
LPPALNRDAANEAEWKPGRSDHELDFKSRCEDRIHRLARAKLRCCSTKPDVKRRSVGRSLEGAAESSASDWARADASSSPRSSASSIAATATAPASRWRSQACACAGSAMATGYGDGSCASRGNSPVVTLPRARGTERGRSSSISPVVSAARRRWRRRNARRIVTSDPCRWLVAPVMAS